MAKFRVEYEVTYTGHVIVEARDAADAHEIFGDRCADSSHAFDVPQARDEAHVEVTFTTPADAFDDAELR